jgi:hypothetical protein
MKTLIIDSKALGFKETDRGYRLDYGDNFFGMLAVDPTTMPANNKAVLYTESDGKSYVLYDQAKCDYIDIKTMIKRIHVYGQEVGLNNAQQAINKVLRNTCPIKHIG